MHFCFGWYAYAPVARRAQVNRCCFGLQLKLAILAGFANVAIGIDPRAGNRKVSDGIDGDTLAVWQRAAMLETSKARNGRNGMCYRVDRLKRRLTLTNLLPMFF